MALAYLGLHAGQRDLDHHVGDQPQSLHAPDGYFLISDLWGVDNLQNRAFALCRWRLREALFGYGEPAPEPWSPA